MIFLCSVHRNATPKSYSAFSRLSIYGSIFAASRCLFGGGTGRVHVRTRRMRGGGSGVQAHNKIDARVAIACAVNSGRKRLNVKKNPPETNRAGTVSGARKHNRESFSLRFRPSRTHAVESRSHGAEGKTYL